MMLQNACPIAINAFDDAPLADQKMNQNSKNQNKITQGRYLALGWKVKYRLSKASSRSDTGQALTVAPSCTSCPSAMMALVYV
jgi:hypothetical protein